MDALAQSVIAFIEANRSWAFWIALAFATAENVALISIVIPSTVILIGGSPGEFALLPCGPPID